MEDVDLGVCGGQLFAGDPARVAVLLPGARYVPAAPLLWFAREAVMAQGWTVLQVWDQRDGTGDYRAWVAQRFQAALAHTGGAQLVIAKSLSTLALPAAQERGLAGVWLTPLCDAPEIRDAVIAAPALLAGGTADPVWDSDVAAGLAGAEVLEVPGADHSLQLPGDPAASLDVLRAVMERVGEFAARL